MSIAQARTARSLEVRELHKEYPTPAEPLVVLRGVSLDMCPGQSLAVLGPSGSGKSTLLNIIGTLDAPTRGSVSFDGSNPFALPPGDLARFRAQRIGFVFQDHHLLPQCTAMENVLIARLAAGPVRAQDKDRAQQLLNAVGLSQRHAHLPSELSGGERQRVAVARALMNRPMLLLCDEPTGNLDARNSAAIGELLTNLAAQDDVMLIVATHSQSLAQRFGRRVQLQEGLLAES